MSIFIDFCHDILHSTSHTGIIAPINMPVCKQCQLKEKHFVHGNIFDQLRNFFYCWKSHMNTSSPLQAWQVTWKILKRRVISSTNLYCSTVYLPILLYLWASNCGFVFHINYNSKYSKLQGVLVKPNFYYSMLEVQVKEVQLYLNNDVLKNNPRCTSECLISLTRINNWLYII